MLARLLTEVRVASLAMVGGGTALCLGASRGRSCSRGGRRRAVFAGTIGDRARSDPSKTQAAARPSHDVLGLRHAKHKDRIFISAVVIGWDSTFTILVLFKVLTHTLYSDI